LFSHSGAPKRRLNCVSLSTSIALLIKELAGSGTLNAFPRLQSRSRIWDCKKLSPSRQGIKSRGDPNFKYPGFAKSRAAIDTTAPARHTLKSNLLNIGL
jgi:hypothetical protein